MGKFNRPDPIGVTRAKRRWTDSETRALCIIAFDFPTDPWAALVHLSHAVCELESRRNPASPETPQFKKVSAPKFKVEKTAGKRRTERSQSSKLPPAATKILKEWIWAHAEKPYPTEDEKKLLVAKTGLTLVQINNWFSNARRRMLKKIKFSRPSRRLL